MQKLDSKGNPYDPASDLGDGEDKTALNRMGKFYMKVLNFSIITRYMIYVAPLALVLAIPIILAATFVIKGNIGGENGARPREFFIWIEISMFTPSKNACPQVLIISQSGFLSGPVKSLRISSLASSNFLSVSSAPVSRNMSCCSRLSRNPFLSSSG